jgi:hypothetical protein
MDNYGFPYKQNVFYGCDFYDASMGTARLSPIALLFSMILFFQAMTMIMMIVMVMIILIILIT